MGGTIKPLDTLAGRKEVSVFEICLQNVKHVCFDQYQICLLYILTTNVLAYIFTFVEGAQKKQVRKTQLCYR